MRRRTKVVLGFEIVLAYVRARWLLHRRDLPHVVASLRRSPWLPRRGILGAVESERLSRATVRGLAAVPRGSRCLTRSLVLLRLLASRGIDASLVIAVQPDEDRALAAHAWLEVEGAALLPPAYEFGQLATL